MCHPDTLRCRSGFEPVVGQEVQLLAEWLEKQEPLLQYQYLSLEIQEEVSVSRPVELVGRPPRLRATVGCAPWVPCPSRPVLEL